jgi:hypothetical protein
VSENETILHPPTPHSINCWYIVRQFSMVDFMLLGVQWDATIISRNQPSLLNLLLGGVLKCQAKKLPNSQTFCGIGSYYTKSFDKCLSLLVSSITLTLIH